MRVFTRLLCLSLVNGKTFQLVREDNGFLQEEWVGEQILGQTLVDSWLKFPKNWCPSSLYNVHKEGDSVIITYMVTIPYSNCPNGLKWRPYETYI